MTRVISAYETFARRNAGRVAELVDRLIAAPRRIRTETSSFVLGADAMPAPVRAGHRSR